MEQKQEARPLALLLLHVDLALCCNIRTNERAHRIVMALPLLIGEVVY